jgi:cytochrome c oxidase subunit 4
MEKDNHEESHNKPKISYGTYILIWMSLLIFTGLTVSVGGMDMRKLAVIVALTIATVKTTLVVTYFMNLKNEDKIFRNMFIFAIMILAVILVLTFSDIIYR